MHRQLQKYSYLSEKINFFEWKNFLYSSKKLKCFIIDALDRVLNAPTPFFFVLAKQQVVHLRYVWQGSEYASVNENLLLKSSELVLSNHTINYIDFKYLMKSIGWFQPNSTRVQNQCSQMFFQFLTFVSMTEVFFENFNFIAQCSLSLWLFKVWEIVRKFLLYKFISFHSGNPNFGKPLLLSLI